MTETKILVLGLGNEILTDDGIGPRLVRDISEILDNPDIKYETACCGGLEVMEYIREFNTVFFIDAIRSHDGFPGKVHYFVPSDFRETSNLSNLHDVDFLTALMLGDMLYDDLPADLHIIAIEIIEDRVFNEQLSPSLAKKYPEILLTVIDLIRKITGR